MDRFFIELLVGLLLIVVTHALTRDRSSSLNKQRRISEWKVSIERRIEAVRDDAIQHYTNPNSLATTQQSAALITANLQEISRQIHRPRYKYSATTDALSASYRSLHKSVTNSSSFMDENRSTLPADAPFIREIAESAKELVACIDRRIEQKEVIDIASQA